MKLIGWSLLGFFLKAVKQNDKFAFIEKTKNPIGIVP